METKKRDRISSTIDAGAKALLKNLSDHTRINQSKLLDEAIFDLVEKYKYTAETKGQKEGGENK